MGGGLRRLPEPRTGFLPLFANVQVREPVIPVWALFLSCFLSGFNVQNSVMLPSPFQDVLDRSAEGKMTMPVALMLRIIIEKGSPTFLLRV